MAGQRGGRPKGGRSPPSDGLGAPKRGTERGAGWRTHYAAPTRPPVRVSGSRTSPTKGFVSCWIRRAEPCHELPGVLGVGRPMGSVGSSAERAAGAALPGPVLFVSTACGGFTTDTRHKFGAFLTSARVVQPCLVLRSTYNRRICVRPMPKIPTLSHLRSTPCKSIRER